MTTGDGEEYGICTLACLNDKDPSFLNTSATDKKGILLQMLTDP